MKLKLKSDWTEKNTCMCISDIPDCMTVVVICWVIICMRDKDHNNVNIRQHIKVSNAWIYLDDFCNQTSYVLSYLWSVLFQAHKESLIILLFKHSLCTFIFCSEWQSNVTVLCTYLQHVSKHTNDLRVLYSLTIYRPVERKGFGLSNIGTKIKGVFKSGKTGFSESMLLLKWMSSPITKSVF